LNECEKAYKDWLRLLEDANANDLLEDAYNIWLTAWEQATVQKTETPGGSAQTQEQ
jgi:hypothetical protein